MIGPPACPTLLSHTPLSRPPTLALLPYTALFRSPALVVLEVHGEHAVEQGVEAAAQGVALALVAAHRAAPALDDVEGDRKSTRLNSSHVEISYAVFCLKKKRAGYGHRCASRRTAR